jgi:DedD protein
MVDARVKERLTGAVILVALLVLLVPELLSGPGSAAGTTSPPNADGQQLRSYTIDLADDAASRRSASGALTQAPIPVVPESSPATPTTQAPAGEQGSGSDAAVRSGTANATPQSAPSSPPARASAPSVPARAVTPPAPRAASDRSSGSGWAIQVGSFASRENAERLARELRNRGFESHVSESSGNGKRLWRVRVGPEPDRASAVALGARLRATGHSGSVVPMP